MVEVESRTPPSRAVVYRPEHAGDVARALAGAFAADPMMLAMLPDDRRRARVLPRYFTSVLKLARREGVVYVSRSSDAADAAADGAVVAMPPGTYPLSLMPQIREVPTLVQAGWRATMSNFRDVPFVDAVHPTLPHWYVMYLGMAPAAQGGGKGGELLRRVLDHADDDGLPTYLVTMKAENPAYYQGFGFSVRDTTTYGPTGPTTWTMLRPPGAIAAVAADEVAS